MTKRPALLTITSCIAVLVVFVLSGGWPLPIAAQGTPAAPAQRPVVTATLPDGTEVQGTLLSACWEQTDPAQPSCVFPVADQLAAISLAAGAQLGFAVTPDLPAPTAFNGTITEANAPAGTVGRTVELRATLGKYNANIDPGEYVLQVIASYPAPDSGEYYVEYGFRLTVTSPPTQVPPPTSTAEPVATDIPPTQEIAATVATTDVPATVPPTATDMPTALPTNTATPVPPTATDTPAPTTVPTTVPTSTPLAPETVVKAGGRDFSPLRTTVTFRSAEGDDVTISRPNAGSNTLRIEAAAGEVVQIQFLGERPAKVVVDLRSADGTTSLNEQEFPGDAVLFYVMPAQAGSFVLAVKASYDNSTATYFYRLTIGG
jgi:hypothetical protein